MIQVYTGNGKGKTTASLGLISRALGRDMKVCLIQFMKKNYQYGEIRFLEKQENIDIFQFGTQYLVDPDNPEEIDFTEAIKAYDQVIHVLESNTYDLIVIDEINVAVAWKLLPLNKQLDIFKYRNQCEIIMTGRYAHKKVILEADLVTEMKEIKHYFNDGIPAREGVEF